MFLQLAHQQLQAYQTAREVALACYRLTQLFPSDERYNLVIQIRRAALSVHLNIAEGASRKSAPERKRYFEIARGSLIEIDAALDLAMDLDYLKNIHTEELGEKLLRCFKLLSGLLR